MKKIIPLKLTLSDKPWLKKIEDMYDIRMADQAHKEWVDGGRKTISHEEMMKRYG